jgi:hypothetical protein
MPKKIEPVMGYKMENIPGMNPGTCCTKEQGDLYTRFRIHILPHLSLTQRPLPLGLGGETAEQDAIEALLVNGFRLDCCNCLSPDCKDRDPDFSLESVRARVTKK